MRHRGENSKEIYWSIKTEGNVSFVDLKDLSVKFFSKC